jgi:hypothetical protein
MAPTDFRRFDDGISNGSKLRELGKKDTRPYLRPMRVVQVRRGSSLLFVKQHYNDAKFVEFDLLKVNFDAHILPARKQQPRGVQQKKLKRIQSDLVPLMNPVNRVFWMDMAINNAVSDVATTEAD